jgi:hypothetical protein
VADNLLETLAGRDAMAKALQSVAVDGAPVRDDPSIAHVHEPPRTRNRLLGIEATIQQIDQKLQLGLHLAVAAHAAHHKTHPAILKGNGWHEGVRGALSGLETTGVRSIQAKRGSTVLKGEATCLDRNARSEIEEQALDKRDCQPIAIDYGEMSRIALSPAMLPFHARLVARGVEFVLECPRFVDGLPNSLIGAVCIDPVSDLQGGARGLN